VINSRHESRRVPVDEDDVGTVVVVVLPSDDFV
jgi:hypothetical protein